MGIMTFEDFEFTKDVFLHDFVHPPARTVITHWTPILTNSNDDIRLTVIEQGGQTRISLHAKEPLQLRFTSREPRIVEYEINNLILSFNLHLKDTCMTDSRSEYLPAQIQLKPSDQKSKVEQKGNNIVVSILDQIAILESAHAILGKQESIDGQKVIEGFQKIQNLDRRSLTPASPRWQLNLERALNEFEQGMSTLNGLFKFKHVYNAVEFATNLNGDDWMKEYKLDAEVCKLAGNKLQQELVEQWRLFYNRTKHSDRAKMGDADTKTYNQGVNNLPSWLSQIRACASSILLQHLKKL
jgi:hypothetical protein